MRNTRKSTLAEVSMSVIKAAFGMSERMGKSLALKVAAAKVLGGTLGAAFFLATAAWGMALCSSPGMTEQDVYTRLAVSGLWLVQCAWMGSALGAMGWLRLAHVGAEISSREMVLLSVFGVTPRGWARDKP